MKSLRTSLLAAICIHALACEYSSDRAIERMLRRETPIGTTRSAVELWCHQRMIPHGELPTPPTGAPERTVITVVTGMSNEGRLFNRDVNGYYYFGADGRLSGISVHQYDESVFQSLQRVNQERE